jgi:hypothetical protein
MRVEVKTCNSVRIMLEQDRVKSQRKIIKGKSEHFQITLDDGKVLDLESPISGVALDPEINITKRNKYMSRLKRTIENDGKGAENGKSIQT